MSVCWSLKTSSEELGNRLQTPTLIGCKFLRILDTTQLALSFRLPARLVLPFYPLRRDQRSLVLCHEIFVSVNILTLFTNNFSPLSASTKLAKSDDLTPSSALLLFECSLRL